MSDENNTPSVPDSQPGQAAPPADTGVPATPSAADASAEPNAATEGEGDEPKKPKHRGGFQKRIDTLTARTRELERQLAEARTPKGDGNGDAAEPKRDSFASYEDYIDARTEYRAAQTFERKQRERDEAAVASAQGKRLDAFRSEMSHDATDEDPGFKKAWTEVTSEGFPISAAMRDFVMDSDDPHSLIEYLANNRDKAAELYTASASQVTRTLARVEAGLVSKPPARTPQAPPPPPTVGGRSTPRIDMAKLAGNKNADDYIAKRRAELAKAS